MNRRQAREENDFWGRLNNVLKKLAITALPFRLKNNNGYFGNTIGRKTLIKHFWLRLLQKFFYNHINENNFSLICRSCENIDILSSLNNRKTIFLFMHQPFVKYLPVWLCEKGFTVNSLVMGRKKPYPHFISVLQKRFSNYDRFFYRPLLTLKSLQEKLDQGENVLLAADGKAGKHFIDIKFGGGTLKTPRGIYVLSQSTGASIVPLFLYLKQIFPFPKFEIRAGKGYQSRDVPENEIDKIESIFSWFYRNIKEQPYMWTRIAE
jgi:lauroyl/myristoyl acyltransferase